MKFSSPQLLIQAILTVVSVICYLVSLSISKTAVIKYGGIHKMVEQRVLYIRKFARMSLFSIFLVSLCIIWGIDFKGMLIFASSFFAVVGISLFASWSILSNITSSIILFFSFPYKIGDEIRIVDGDNSIQGKLVDMTVFSMLIRNEDGNIVSYPNNMAILKPVIKLARETTAS
jgi:MscS family membrane protein